MQFDFGRNWAEFSDRALTDEAVHRARVEFEALVAPAGVLQDKSFIDIGFGQGLSLLSAAAAGARVVGVDINPTCGDVLQANRRFFPGLADRPFPVIIGSILDASTVERARAASPGGGGYEIVHSWGVLHHTGDMATALRNAASLVKPDGHFIIALYNRHWSSRPWLAIKYLYCKSPTLVQRLVVAVLYPVIYAAKWTVTRDDPRKQARGMDFYYNVVDWVGGYPYEYADRAEVGALVEPLGFEEVKFVASEVPTGCNEFVFRRTR
jgi:SAM-dependent methyltransferase